MKQPSIQTFVLVGILGLFSTAAVFTLVLTWFLFLPTILWFHRDNSDLNSAVVSYQIARDGFVIALVSGIVLGFAVPVICTAFKRIYGKQAS